MLSDPSFLLLSASYCKIASIACAGLTDFLAGLFRFLGGHPSEGTASSDSRCESLVRQISVVPEVAATER